MDEPTPRKVGIAAQRAVCAIECTLAPELRHLVMVLAVLANRETGEGRSGQLRVAQAMGVTERTVRRLLGELADTDSPVTVMRQARMRRSGRGRTSDAYRLFVQPDTDDRLETHNQPDAGDQVVATTNRTPNARPTGHAVHDQPDTGVRASDPGSDPRSDPGSGQTPERGLSKLSHPQPQAPGEPEQQHGGVGERGATQPSARNPDPWGLAPPGEDPDAPTEATRPPTKRAARTRRLATSMPEGFEPSEAHRALARELAVDLGAEFPRFADHHEAKGSRFASWDAALRTWLRNARRFADRDAAPGGAADPDLPRGVIDADEQALRAHEEHEREKAARAAAGGAS